MDEETWAVRLTARIVEAYLRNNALAAERIGELIGSVGRTVLGLGTESPPAAGGQAVEPAVPIARSLSDDRLICLEDGLAFKSLKRHLQAHHHMTPEAYRRRWGLPDDYPMVAPRYAQTRSQVAKDMGLGRAVTRRR